MTADVGNRVRPLRLSLMGLAVACLLSGCVKLGLETARTTLDPAGAATPELFAQFEGDPPVVTVADWETRRAPLLRAAFERELYGPVPHELKAHARSRRVVDPHYAGDTAVLEEIDIAVGDGADAPSFRLALALPKTAKAGQPAPLLLTENFCGNPTTAAAPGLSAPRAAGVCTNKGFRARLVRFIFGAYAAEEPGAQIVGHGYAYATLFASELVGDNPIDAPEDLKRFAKLTAPGREPQGAIAVWAAAFSWSLDVLDADPRIDPNRTAVYGHSRHGKAALIATAFDPRIEALIAHQSGKGGATLTRSYAGESVKEITDAYPHWFSPRFASYGDRETRAPIDQHQLLALVAPRPVLLGNGWNDVWSDPTGSFRAAQGASPAWRLYGAEGLVQAGMRDKRPMGQGPAGDISFYLRTGAHGQRKQDWATFLDWLDRRLKPGVAHPLPAQPAVADVTPAATAPQSHDAKQTKPAQAAAEPSPPTSKTATNGAAPSRTT